MRAWIASILLAAVCSLAPAFAQDQAPLTEKPSQEQIDAAKDLLRANNTAANMQTMITVLLPLETAQLRRAHPTASDDTIHTILSATQNAITSHTDDLISLYAISYARHFSIAEMHALAAFYRSDAGQKYLAEIPAIAKETAPVGIAFMKGVIAQEIEKAVENMRAQGVKI